jgi:predicted nuclease with TOPRIM domain
MMDAKTATEIMRGNWSKLKVRDIRKTYDEIADFIEQQAQEISGLRQSLKTPISHDMIIEARRERDEWEEKYKQSCIKRAESIDELFKLKAEIAILQNKLDEWKENHECNLDFKNQLVSENKNQRAVIDQQETYAELGWLGLITRGNVCSSTEFQRRKINCVIHCTNYQYCQKRAELLEKS